MRYKPWLCAATRGPCCLHELFSIVSCFYSNKYLGITELIIQLNTQKMSGELFGLEMCKSLNMTG